MEGSDGSLSLENGLKKILGEGWKLPPFFVSLGIKIKKVMASKLKHQHIDRITHNTLEEVLRGLTNELLGQGYTPSEIKAYISDKVEQCSKYTEQVAVMLQQEELELSEEDSEDFFKKINEGLGIRW